MTIYVSANERENYGKYLHDVQRVSSDDDIFFLANGSIFNKETVTVGIERKRINEDLPRCIQQSHHHLDQLRRMKQTHAAVYLLIEGDFNVDEEGFVVIPRWVDNEGRKKVEWVETNPRILYNNMMKHLETIRWQMNVHVVFTKSFQLTCAWLWALYNWWAVPVESHTSAFAYQQSFTLLGEIPMMRKIANILPGVGWKLSKELADAVGYPAAMNDMTQKDIMKLDGFGKKRAEDIYNAWWGKT